MFTNEDPHNIPTFTHPNKNFLSHFTITNEDMKQALKSLKPNKSPGPDGIHPRILKELSEELAYPLRLLFEKTISCGKLPDAWKTAEVRPIFKKGIKSSPGNYRPVSLTSVVCKVFEGFIRDKLYDHMIKNKILSNVQHGFVKGRSCITQLLSTLHEWFQYLDQDIPVDAIYLDFRKAFDTVPHQRLLSKLHGYGVRGQILDWIRDFLAGRQQYVSVNGNESKSIPVTSGVPQGSVLGPILFIYFINDLPDVIKCVSRIFADDTKAFKDVQNPPDNVIIQESINAMVEWGDQWMAYFNIDKCNTMHLGKANPRHVYTMKNGNILNNLSTTDCEKDLGVYVDQNLTFTEHINTTVKKARNMCYMLMRAISYKCPDIMIPLYKSLVRPVLEYGNVIWCPRYVKDVDFIEDVQKYYTKRIIGMSDLEYEDRLRALKLPSLGYRRVRGDMIEVFKITHGFYDTKVTKSLFKLADSTNKTKTNSPKIDSSNTRTNGYKIDKVSTNTSAFQHFFTNRVVNCWNSLPRHVVGVDTVNSFKGALDRHLSAFKYVKRVDCEVVASVRA